MCGRQNLPLPLGCYFRRLHPADSLAMVIESLLAMIVTGAFPEIEEAAQRSAPIPLALCMA